MSALNKRLNNLAFKKTYPFCYGCYKRVVQSKECPSCGSDDLMRELVGVGVEYGTDWVIKQLVSENVKEFECKSSYEEFLREIYGENVVIGSFTFDTVDVIKKMDEIAYRCGISDYIADLESDGKIVSFDNGATYFSTAEIEDYLESEKE